MQTTFNYCRITVCLLNEPGDAKTGFLPLRSLELGRQTSTPGMTGRQVLVSRYGRQSLILPFLFLLCVPGPTSFTRLSHVRYSKFSWQLFSVNITCEHVEFRIDFVSFKGLNFLKIEKTFMYPTFPSKIKHSKD